MVFIGYRLMPDIDNSQFSDNIQKKDTVSQLTPSKEKVAVILILGTIACMLLESVIGIKMYLTASIGACLLVLCGVLSEREALGSIHQPTVFLFAGVLALSDAIKITGAGDVVADWMISLLGNTTNPYVIMAVFFIIPFILTQVYYFANIDTETAEAGILLRDAVKLRSFDPHTGDNAPFAAEVSAQGTRLQLTLPGARSLFLVSE